ncbi:exopolyphosphatase PRUNE1 [Ochlerotatus camptorhynchus]|uniref:exopolyphosphatase PRUNE1 n=1 Tax=Ochlerotatus camptorhynchus TaxID=644619 RepID=UPI0031D95B55
MNSFIKQCKKSLKLPRIVVIGNESCDLDSAVCSISLAFHLSRTPGTFLKTVNGADCVVPVLNVSREELPLKTEVVYYLHENRFDLSDLICKDEINLPEVVDDTSYVLVDHHISKYRSNVVGVIDHRPFDTSSLLNADIFKYIDQVGSCASLITKLIQDSGALQEKSNDNTELMNFLYGPIVLDTVNFSKEADKARELDHQMAKTIEQYLNIKNSSEIRQILFDNLVAKRSDVSCLDSLQMLSKDLKIVSRNGRVVAIPGYPILVQDYIKLENAATNLQLFAQKTGSNVIVLMGMTVNSENGSVRRDLGIININDPNLQEQIITAVNSSTVPDFSLNKHDDSNFLDGHFFEQRNIKASRKQLLPLINDVLDNKC